jgi:hypothetical protein
MVKYTADLIYAVRCAQPLELEARAELLQISSASLALADHLIADVDARPERLDANSPNFTRPCARCDSGGESEMAGVSALGIKMIFDDDWK